MKSSYVIVNYIIELIEYIIEMMFLFQNRFYDLSIDCPLEAQLFHGRKTDKDNMIYT